MAGFIQVQYVGKHEPRPDTLNPRSGRVWNKIGSVIDIPEAEAYRYLAYPDIWKRVGFGVIKEAIVREANSDETISLLCGFLSIMNTENLNKIAQCCQELALAPAESGTAEVDLNDPKAVEVYNKRIKQVVSAIQTLSKNADNFDPNTNKPRLEAVQRACRIQNLTQADVDAAWLLKKPL